MGDNKNTSRELLCASAVVEVLRQRLEVFKEAQLLRDHSLPQECYSELEEQLAEISLPFLLDNATARAHGDVEQKCFALVQHPTRLASLLLYGALPRVCTWPAGDQQPPSFTRSMPLGVARVFLWSTDNNQAWMWDGKNAFEQIAQMPEESLILLKEPVLDPVLQCVTVPVKAKVHYENSTTVELRPVSSQHAPERWARVKLSGENAAIVGVAFLNAKVVVAATETALCVCVLGGARLYVETTTYPANGFTYGGLWGACGHLPMALKKNGDTYTILRALTELVHASSPAAMTGNLQDFKWAGMLPTGEFVNCTQTDKSGACGKVYRSTVLHVSRPSNDCWTLHHTTADNHTSGCTNIALCIPNTVTLL